MATSSRETSLNPQSHDYWASRYNAHPSAKEKASAVNAVLEEILPEHIPILLDLGCGTGLSSINAMRRADIHLAVDQSGDMLSRGVWSTRTRLLQADAHVLPIRPDSIDVAICCWTLHILRRPDLAMTEVARVLKPGGTFWTTAGHTPGVSSDVSGLLLALRASFGVPMTSPDSLALLRNYSKNTGLTLIRALPITTKHADLTPFEAAARVSQGQFLWWPPHYAADHPAALACVRALRDLPEPDKPRPGPSRFRLLGFRRSMP